MDHQRIIEELRQEFPGCPITCLPPEAPTEIVVEIERTTDPDRSVVIAIIERSPAQSHEMIEEEYYVEAGTLEMHCGGEHHTMRKVLQPGDRVPLCWDMSHWCHADPPARVRIAQTPARKPGDHRFW